MKKALIIMAGLAAAATIFATALFAADMPQKAPPAPVAVWSWSGFYASGYGLYGANITDTTVATLGDVGSVPHGPGIGGGLGYNFQPASGLVFGVRADIAYLNMTGNGNIGAAALSVSNATNYIGDLDALIGVPLTPDNRLLAYGVGGFAFGGAKPNLQVGSLSAAASDTSTGWNVGAGLAYQLDRNLSVFIEGDYYQLGDKSLSITAPGGGVLATSTAKYHDVAQKAGIVYRFGP